MNKDELKSILDQHRLWFDGNGGRRADLRYADLQYADLQYADLQRADLQYADLRYADLRGADLKRADLQRADLKHVDLRGADLRGADLQGANLQDADLQDADLRGADLRSAALRGAALQGADIDYACLPLWCGSKGAIVDRRIAAQIAAHFCSLDCDDADYQAARTAILEFAKTSHRADDLGLVKERESGGGKTCDVEVKQ